MLLKTKAESFPCRPPVIVTSCQYTLDRGYEINSFRSCCRPILNWLPFPLNKKHPVLGVAIGPTVHYIVDRTNPKIPSHPNCKVTSTFKPKVASIFCGRFVPDSLTPKTPTGLRSLDTVHDTYREAAPVSRTAALPPNPLLGLCTASQK